MSGSRVRVLVLVVMALAVAQLSVAEWQKGVTAYQSKDYATAVKEFEQVVETTPDFAGAYYMMGLCQNAQGQRSQALASLRKAVELDGENVSYKVALGQTLVQAKQYQEAYSTLKPLKMDAMESKYRSSYALLFAQAATKTNRPEEAISVLNRQTQSDSSNARLYQALGVAEDAAGDDSKAFRAFKKAFDLDAKDSKSGRSAAYAAIAVARRARIDSDKISNYTQAAQVAEKLAAADGSFEHNLLAGEAWLGAKKYDKALSWFGKAKSKKPGNALVHFYMGQCHSSLGKFDSAMNSLQEALKIGASSDKLRKQIYETMGYVAAKQKDYNGAIRYYTDAGNSAKVAEMQANKEKQAQNELAGKERREFKAKIDALRTQIAELEKLGESDDVKQMRQQLAELEKAYAELE